MMDLCNEQVLKFLALAFLLGAAFSQDYDYPTYSEDDLPETGFSCNDKVHGAFYADIDTGCQMYHVCSRDKDGINRSTKFLCGNGTVFDQRHLVCQDYRKVQHCRDSEKYYRNEAHVHPMYSRRLLPETSFSCYDKEDGGYYADIETDCKMYHVCSKDKDGVMRSSRFLCGTGLAFDQLHLVCQHYRSMERCEDSGKYYSNETRHLGLLEERIRLGINDKEDYDYLRYPEIILPETSFSCEDKSNGGYYADIETDCQMYHVCLRDKHGVMKSAKFLCGDGTVFDQRYLVCQDYNKMHRCKDSEKYYRKTPAFFNYWRQG